MTKADAEKCLEYVAQHNRRTERASMKEPLLDKRNHQTVSHAKVNHLINIASKINKFESALKELTEETNSIRHKHAEALELFRKELEQLALQEK